MLGLGQAQAAEPVSPAELATNEGIPYPAVIAHRGASYDAPESTAAAYKVARDLGADYLELDLQRSKDGVLFALHDNNLQRTTDVAHQVSRAQRRTRQRVHLERAANPRRRQLVQRRLPGPRAPWFRWPEDPEPGRHHQDRRRQPSHKPGLYIETKEPKQFPGIEADLKNKLLDKGWLSSAGSKLGKSNTGVGQGKGRVVLQTFETASLKELQKEMPNTPKILLLWVGEGSIEPKSKVTFAESGEPTKAAYYAKQEPKDAAEFEKWVDEAKSLGAIGTGPSAELTDHGDQSYTDLVKPEMNKLTHDKGLLVHVYTVDEPVDFEKVMKAGVDGIFTNRAAELLKFYKRWPSSSVQDLLNDHKY